MYHHFCLSRELFQMKRQCLSALGEERSGCQPPSLSSASQMNHGQIAAASQVSRTFCSFSCQLGAHIGRSNCWFLFILGYMLQYPFFPLWWFSVHMSDVLPTYKKKYFGEWNYPAESWDVIMSSILIKLSFYFFGSQDTRRMSNQLRQQFAQRREAYGLSGNMHDMPVLFPALRAAYYLPCGLVLVCVVSR